MWKLGIKENRVEFVCCINIYGQKCMPIVSIIYLKPLLNSDVLVSTHKGCAIIVKFVGSGNL